MSEQKKEEIPVPCGMPENHFKYEICNVSTTGQGPLDANMNGKSHVSKVGRKAENMPNCKEIMKCPDNCMTNLFKCEVCEVTASSEANLQAHMQGKAHADKLKKL